MYYYYIYIRIYCKLPLEASITASKDELRAVSRSILNDNNINNYIKSKKLKLKKVKIKKMDMVCYVMINRILTFIQNSNSNYIYN